MLDVALLLRITVDQFADIEIEPFPAEISPVSLWLMDHLCNREGSLEFGQNYARIPIRDTPHILCTNALTTDWKSLAPGTPETRPFSYILGNPPFNGARTMSPEQKADVLAVFGDTASVAQGASGERQRGPGRLRLPRDLPEEEIVARLFERLRELGG